MKDNNNNNELKYDSSRNYILSMLLGELIGVLVTCFFWFFVDMDTENVRVLHISYLISFIIGTILILYSHYPYIVRQLKDKDKDHNVQ